MHDQIARLIYERLNVNKRQERIAYKLGIDSLWTDQSRVLAWSLSTYFEVLRPCPNTHRSFEVCSFQPDVTYSLDTAILEPCSGHKQKIQLLKFCCDTLQPIRMRAVWLRVIAKRVNTPSATHTHDEINSHNKTPSRVYVLNQAVTSAATYGPWLLLRRRIDRWQCFGHDSKA